ncbi:MAG: gliding motility lipoprotein GldH [Muribaculaceae bacterium]|nr:gliding motility lipoprotein GldH [Muribaculaceae bacterium]
MSDHSVLNKMTKAVAMTMFIAAAMLIFSACEHKPTLSHASYVNLPSTGWLRETPLTFSPEYDDSTGYYDLSLAVRHDNSYKFCNLSLVVDLISTDSTVNRKRLEMTLADEYGNWTGGGFGALYQKKVPIVSDITPNDVCSVKVWQAMENCDTLQGLVNVGLFTSPN